MPNGAHEQERAPGFKIRAVAAEINGRRVNEAIGRGFGSREPAVFICECGTLGCNTTVSMLISEYEAVRTDFDRFLVVPGHETAGIDVIVERHSEYLVVTKHCAAGGAARETNPRTEAHSEDAGTSPKGD